MINKIQKFLLWSEKYTKIDMLYLAGGGFWIILGQIAASAMSLALAMLFARFLPKEKYAQ